MRYFLTLLTVFVCSLLYGQVTIDIRSLGAVGDSVTMNTVFIQEAIDQVSNSGGGTVLIDSGIYLSSTIVLKSNITLRVTPTARLKAPNDTSQYPYHQYNTPSWADVYTFQSLIFAEDQSNIRITGGGVIDGNGSQFSYIPLAQHARPFGLRLHQINGLIIDSIYLQQAPQWMVHIMGCQNVHINAVNVYNQCWGANDGIDIDCCRNVLVENSVFNTNDDCIPVKTQTTDSVCRDILIRNCTMSTYERPVKVGCESFGPIINVRFENIVVNQSPVNLGEIPLNAIYVAIADGGSADSIFIDSIQINTLYQTPIFIRLDMRDFQYDTSTPPPLPNYVRNVWINHVVCPGTIIPCSITGLPGYDVQNIYLDNIAITVPGGAPGVTGNLPELATTRPECDMWSDSLPAYGLFVWHESGLFLDNFCVTLTDTDVRPEFYFVDTNNIPSFQTTSTCTQNYNGIQEVEQNALTVYPNPTSDMVSISHLPSQVQTVVMYTLTGTRVSVTPTLGREHISLPVSILPAGMYILEALGNNYAANAKVAIVR